MSGEFAIRKMKKNKKRQLWKKAKYRQKILRVREKLDPLQGSPQASGIVLEKRALGQKQPHSGLIKCVRVRLIKNNKEVTAFVPRTGAIKQVSEHDKVLIEGLGGSQGGPTGSIPGVKYRVSKVNGIALEELRTGRKQKPAR
ncbi:30S ribosomal protein S12 [archaeon]|nr:30S ribosomal protein S12 [archaeon]